jgi:hypothetical protein
MGLPGMLSLGHDKFSTLVLSRAGGGIVGSSSIQLDFDIALCSTRRRRVRAGAKRRIN